MVSVHENDSPEFHVYFGCVYFLAANKYVCLMLTWIGQSVLSDYLQVLNCSPLILCPSDIFLTRCSNWKQKNKNMEFSLRNVSNPALASKILINRCVLYLQRYPNRVKQSKDFRWSLKYLVQLLLCLYITGNTGYNVYYSRLYWSHR